MGPMLRGPSSVVTRWPTGSRVRPSTSIGVSTPGGVARRNTALRRATSSRGAERLGDVIVGTHLQPLDLVVFLDLGGQHDDGDVGGGLFLLQTAGQLDATGARQHPVEQDQVGFLVNDQGMGFPGIRCLQIVVVCHFEGHGDHLADGGLVIDNQDGFSIHGVQTRVGP